MDQMYAAAIQTFDRADIFLASRGYTLWLPQNFVLTAQRGESLPLEDYIRYDTVKPPDIQPGVILEDSD
jgi:hypothetical protein